ncbi:MAG: hypothetical protein BAJATHORv1_90002 [Candidatus Thorarchaeota archaeon]|nr:MAG: hypothetical protein BAJATHORv1_90002 [Candidatus Thorarchaeota archaeon]
MSKKPKYWDSWKGRILRAIILDKLETWTEVRERAGLEQRQMFKVVRELQRLGILEYLDDKRFRM